MATRVRESIISTACAPPSRRCSAIRVATNAERSRTSGGLVGGGDDDDAARQTLGAEVVLEELADLAPTLADQRDDRHLGVGAAGDHRQQAGLADAGTGEQAHALPAPDRDQGVHDADAQVERGVDAGAVERVRRAAVHGQPGVRAQRTQAVDRSSEAVDDAAEQPRADGD